ncbi:hypothetical protein AUEXF2481DRAFT_8061 [Aureobasidium subglaciale EXF-2481]|uniref:Uncharacterized protein n=1 Tax=Aureobasidium subglaciale (strain EXF-2481) TaxID=1043005 RepID=A0A074Y315_AURSE|nr:uncharacterized protein AUEXF2481DRAFT_8061 [Aureobasidium subglaciale EXF-2481]KEQ92095.1 hypothetical protein AUEXF2481DRAFT_8061 [Aureobasidium subglaciale EXF-2481]
MGINGLANGYPQLQAYLDQNLINGSAAAFKKPLTQCLGDDTNQFIFKNIYIFFDNGQDCGCRHRQERSGDALSFIKARFNSVPAAAGCKTNTVITDLADAGALAGLSSSLVGALLAFLQIPIGASRLPSVIGSFFL